MSIVEYMKQRGTNFNYDKVIYLSHGYGGNITNLNDITLKFKQFVEKYPNYLFISPVNMYHELYQTTEYHQGLDMCLYLLDSMATEMWVCDINYEISKGCMAEIEYCKSHDIPIKYFVSDSLYTTEPFQMEVPF